MGGALFHAPVLCQPAVDLLVTDPEGTYVDGTTGGGGHAECICGRLSGAGRLVCIDRDEEALAAAGRRLARHAARVRFVRGDFGSLSALLHAEGAERVHGLLLDLGVSSHQIDDPARGFSYRVGGDEPLDMRMDRRQARTARDVVNGYDERSLADLLWRFGEERQSRRIARLIVARRPLGTAGALCAAVEQAVGRRFLVKSLSRVFQALRIEVNGELQSLTGALEQVLDLLVPGGRIAVISYHSLEDRIVKEFMRREAAVAVPSAHPLVPDTPRIPRLVVLTRKPVTPGHAEVAENPRSRSAKLRAAERRRDA